MLTNRFGCLLVAAFVCANLCLASAGRQHHRRSGISTTVLPSTASLAATVASQSAMTTATRSRRHSDATTTWLGAEFRLVRRIYDACQETNDFTGCLKQKAVSALSRAIEKDSIKIMDGLVLEKQNHTDPQSLIEVVADARTFNGLSLVDRTLVSQIDKLVRTHTLKFDMSVGRGHEDGGGGGGGKKKDKGGGHIKYVVAALLTAMGIAGPIGLKALAAIAGKALVISKVALTIASIIALKKLFSHDHAEETSFQVHAGEHNRRNTFVIRPVAKASPAPAVNAASVDPYRYYYEYH